MNRVTILLLPIVLAACAPDAIIDRKGVALSAGEVERVQEAVKYSLVDASSASFRNLTAADVTRQNSGVSRVVCGEVNAKNRMGGFNGYSVFLTKDFRLQGIDSPGQFPLYTTLCESEIGTNWRG